MSAKIREIIDEINAAFARNEGEAMLNHCLDEIEWTMVGESTHSGHKAIREELAAHKTSSPPVIENCRTMVDGKLAACFGEMSMTDSAGEIAKFSFCDVYEFAGDKIAKLTSYVVNTTPKSESGSAAA